MGILRSEQMFLYRVVFSKDRAWEDMNALGRLNACQFVNMNKDVVPYKLPFSSMVKRCEETEAKVA